MNEQKNNGRGIFYGVIGVATLVVAIIGATFAYFTASKDIQNAVTGNMATITFDLKVTKVTKADETKGGMIPMSNTMVEAALAGKNDAPVRAADDDAGIEADTNGDPEICVDDNGNAVCQIYKIAVINGGTAGMYLDGYVTLTGGSGMPTDVPIATYDSVTKNYNLLSGDALKWENITPSLATGAEVVPTTMRWAQVFCEGTDNQLDSCTTAGTTTTGTTSTGNGFTANWAAISNNSDTTGHNTSQIKYTGNTVTAKGSISGNEYDIINTNYIRISDHSATASGYTRTADVTSALVFNQFIAPKQNTNKADTTSQDSSETLPDAQVYYIVVWLSETGTNQTAGATTDGTNAILGVPSKDDALNFFYGTVTFLSAQGSEVTATFSNYAAVRPNTTPGA